MLKKLFISAILLIAVLSFVVSLLKGNNNPEKTVSIPDRVAVINIQGPIMSGDGEDTLFDQTTGVTSAAKVALIAIARKLVCYLNSLMKRAG